MNDNGKAPKKGVIQQQQLKTKKTEIDEAFDRIHELEKRLNENLYSVQTIENTLTIFTGGNQKVNWKDQMKAISNLEESMRKLLRWQDTQSDETAALKERQTHFDVVDAKIVYLQKIVVELEDKVDIKNRQISNENKK